MRKISRVLFIAIFAINTFGASALAEPINDHDALKTRITLNKKSPQAILTTNKSKADIKLVLDEKSGMPLKGQEPQIVKIVPGESNVAMEQRIAAEKSAQSRVVRAQPARPRAIRIATAPGNFDALYQAAGGRFGIPWQILAAVHSVESGQSGDTARSSHAGATGPMQFLPSTFRAYAVDGDGDGVASIYSVVDSVYSAANYISANLRTKGSIQGALWQYSHSWSYVNKVLGIARSFGY